MYFSRLRLDHWRNFKELDVVLEPRMFFVGPNAAGKSNLLDAFLFLRDLAHSGGLRKAVLERGGSARLGCMASRGQPDIGIAVEVRAGRKHLWRYSVRLRGGRKQGSTPVLAAEQVDYNGTCLLNRPNAADQKDPRLLEQTHLQQISCNREFRELADFIGSIFQPQLAPQLIQFHALDASQEGQHDPFGFSLFHRIASTPERIRKARLEKIEQALQQAVPEFKTLREAYNPRGGNRLEAVFESWMPRTGTLGEADFSEGTLRLIALLWTLLSGDGPLLLEEPELSLHPAVAARLAPMIWRLRAGRQRQVFITTHSADLLSDPGLTAGEILLLKPAGAHGTHSMRASELEDVNLLVAGGMNLGEAVLPKTVPEKASRLAFPSHHEAASRASRS